MVYLLKMVIFHDYVSHNQMVTGEFSSVDYHLYYSNPNALIIT